MADAETPLEIEFLDPIDDIEVGRSFRFHVLQRNARGDRHAVAIDDLDFVFSPIPWGVVVSTSDPGVSAIEVIEVVEPEDVFLVPHYSVGATMKPRAGRTLAPKRKVRITSVALEIELGFAIGQERRWKPFSPLTLPRPVDLATARLSDDANQSLVVRDGRVFLRVEKLEALPATVELTFPNGETAALRIEGTLRGVPVEREPRPADARARDEADDPATVEAREEVRRLRRYIASFGGAGKRRPDAETSESIRRRIGVEIERAKEKLKGYEGPKAEEILALFKAATDLIPDWLREASPVAGGNDYPRDPPRPGEPAAPADPDLLASDGDSLRGTPPGAPVPASATAAPAGSPPAAKAQ